MRNKLKKLKDLPRLPGCTSNPHRDVEIKGVSVRVYKARANRTIPVSARLLSLLGDELYQLVSHDEESTEGPAKSAGPLGALLEVDFDNDEQVKTAMIGVVLPELYSKVEELTEDEGPGSIHWYFERILAGNVEYSGARPDDLDDLEDMGFGVPELTKLFWTGVRLAFFPTLGVPATSDGRQGPGTPEPSKAPEMQSFSGESAKMTGPVGQTSIATG